MPAIKSAKKKLRQDKKRQLRNKKVKDNYKQAVKKAKTQPTVENVRLATQLVDKAAKVFIIHKNKAARIKSALSKLATKKAEKTSTVDSKPKKPATRKKTTTK